MFAARGPSLLELKLFLPACSVPIDLSSSETAFLERINVRIRQPKCFISRMCSTDVNDASNSAIVEEMSCCFYKQSGLVFVGVTHSTTYSVSLAQDILATSNKHPPRTPYHYLSNEPEMPSKYPEHPDNIIAHPEHSVNTLQPLRPPYQYLATK